MFTIKQPKTLVLLILGCLASGVAGASTIAYDNQITLSPLQGFGGSLGLDFQVSTAISVSELGVFDNGSTSNLLGVDGHSGVTVQIYNISGTPTAVGPSVNFTPSNAGFQVNGDAFMNVTPFLLGPGTYSVVTFNDDNYNTGSLANGTSIENNAGLITFVGSGRYSAGFTFPSTPDTGVTNKYDAGTFAFDFASVPEPSTFALFGLGAVALFLRRRRA
jgi:PEP-CTERM motif